jgi:recombination protein RecA
MSTDNSERRKALDNALGQIEKQFGQGSIMKLGSHSITKVPVISTGALTLDVALGVGGVPRGRITEIYGPESSGKTTLALSVVAHAQKAGGVAAYIDAEHAIDPSYARRLGVNIEEMLISQPDCGEDALSIAETLVRSNAVDVVVVDSVAALVPKAEIEGEMGDSFVGLQARLMSQALRKLTGAIGRSSCACVFINQIREKIGVMFGNPETTTGGRALKFYSSVRLDIRRIATLKDSQGVSFGIRAKVNVVKNKVAPPFKVGEFDILYDEGISYEGSLVDLGTDLNVIQKKGSWLSWGETRLGQGRDAVKEQLKNDPAMTQKLEAAVKQAAGLTSEEAPAAKPAEEPPAKKRGKEE